MMTDSDEAFSALIREEYERIGCDEGTLREVTGSAATHSRNLWDGKCAWTAFELVLAVSVPGFADRFTDEESRMEFIFEPFLTGAEEAFHPSDLRLHSSPMAVAS